MRATTCVAGLVGVMVGCGDPTGGVIRDQCGSKVGAASLNPAEIKENHEADGFVLKNRWGYCSILGGDGTFRLGSRWM